jgi:hypothetical protein
MPEITNHVHSEAELQKLRLEIQQLQIDIANSERLRRFDLAMKLVPAVAVLVTVLGFVFTVWQYRSGGNEPSHS